MTSLVGFSYLAKNANIRGSFPNSVERDDGLAVPVQRIVRQTNGVCVKRTCPSRPLEVSKRLRGIGNVEDGELIATLKSDCQQGIRRHLRFLTTTRIHGDPTQEAYSTGPSFTRFKSIDHIRARRLGRVVVGYPSKVDGTGSSPVDLTFRRKAGWPLTKIRPKSTMTGADYQGPVVGHAEYGTHEYRGGRLYRKPKQYKLYWRADD